MKIVVDQCVGVSCPIFIQFLDWLGERQADFVFLAKAYPNIPDIEILDKILDDSTILLTSDRTFHNEVVSKRLKSFTLDLSDHLTDKKLSHVQAKRKLGQSVRKELSDSYSPASTERVREFVSSLSSSFSQKQLENFRTKRRRIRSYFSDVANMDSADLTIGSEILSKGCIGGYFLKINSKSNLKALGMASEGYCYDVSCENSLSPIFYTLLHFYQLHLTHLPVNLYITSPVALDMCQKIIRNASCEDSISQGVKILIENLSKVELMPCIKGPFYDRMASKLLQLKSKKTNELMSVDFISLAQKLHSII